MFMVEATGICDGTVAFGGVGDFLTAEMATSELGKGVVAFSVTAGDGVTLTQDPGDTKETEEVVDEEFGSDGVLAPPSATALEFVPPVGGSLLTVDTRDLCSARLAARLADMGQQKDQLYELITRSQSRLEQKKD